ncbi:MAG: thioredoxin domain-containing protein [Planctomycetota bacterium]|jgi:uncharacterized protein YyaL (SSP411 family)
MFSAKINNVVLILLCLAMPLVASGQADKTKTEGDQNMARKPKNRLAAETSPYLLQHADNPVNWFPWSTEAFEIAKQQDKPIFLSIGYSTCHWCHVMEHESFENKRIADIMNEHFICIKVDREQRPDIDKVYMDAVQMMTGTGGWPLSVFLTPDGKPFYGGTYFPPTDRYGRPGFDRVLLAIADTWKKKRQDLTDSASRISDVLNQLTTQTGQEKLSPAILENAYSYLANTFDHTYGGFGRAPKFPQPSYLSMLLNYWHRTHDQQALEMVKTTLNAMAKGGIYDHLSGGFHRYSTDALWLVPHFEKMLYDQALISKAYIQAYQITREELYARIAREIFDYLLHDMTDPKGGFYSAEDADSEGKEGLFYLWTPQQITEVLDTQDAEIFNLYYGITEKGNFEEGKTILNVIKSTDQIAKQFKKSTRKVENILERSREKLLLHRAKRIRPHRDDKVITAWNGLMISSLAYGGTVLKEKKYIDAAKCSAEFVLNTLQKDNRLMRYYRDGHVVSKAVLDDYASMIIATLDLYEATFDSQWLAEARNLADRMIELFGDTKTGAFFLTGSDAEKLIVRTRPDYDGSVPSGNSLAAFALLKLGKITMDNRYTDLAERLLNNFSTQMTQSPTALTAMLIALDFHLGPSQEIVIAGDHQSPDTREMLNLIQSRFLPNAVVLLHPTDDTAEQIEKLVPFLANQLPVEEKATTYLCENYICKKPTNNIDELNTMLDEITKPPEKAK